MAKHILILLLTLLSLQAHAAGKADFGKEGQKNNLTSAYNSCGGCSEGLFRFAGQYFDSETGLHYNRFRYYCSKSGTYISQDPIRLHSGEPNFYAYVKDSNSWIDPLGLDQVSRRAAFRSAKQQAGIPKSAQFTTHKFVYDGKFENRTVYEFDVDGKKKYVILHEEDKFGRGKHFHGAEPNVKNPHNPMNPGKYNQLPGHHPEDMRGFKPNGCN